ncbi:flagellar export chaperone FliS [Silvimonas sp. JCM 19000]
MSYAVKKALKQYGDNSLDVAVESASPLKLVVMLYEGAIKAVGLARYHMEAGHIPDKGKAISHAISIIDQGLRQSLDKSKGGDLAENLDQLYRYMTEQLLLANIHNKLETLDHVGKLLGELKESWDQIEAGSRAGAQPVAETPPPAAANANNDRGTLSYGRA